MFTNIEVSTKTVSKLLNIVRVYVPGKSYRYQIKINPHAVEFYDSNEKHRMKYMATFNGSIVYGRTPRVIRYRIVRYVRDTYNPIKKDLTVAYTEWADSNLSPTHDQYVIDKKEACRRYNYNRNLKLKRMKDVT